MAWGEWFYGDDGMQEGQDSIWHPISLPTYNNTDSYQRSKVDRFFNTVADVRSVDEVKESKMDDYGGKSGYLSKKYTRGCMYHFNLLPTEN